MDKVKLEWKIFAFLLCFSGMLIIILWVFQNFFFYDLYKMIRKSEIEESISYVENNIDKSNLRDIFLELENDKEIYVTYSNTFVMPQIQLNQNRRRLIKETITETVEYERKNGKTISLTFYAIITPVNATISTLQTHLYVITGIMLLLSVGLAILIARHIAKPIKNINSSAKALAGGDYGIDFSGRGFLEISELSDTLNMTARELSKTEKLRRELMANISHDLRTPLALIYSYAEMMNDFPDEITSEQTQTIMKQTKQLSSLVDDVLSISKLESGAEELKVSPYNLTLSILETAERIRELLKKDGYIIGFEYEREAVVSADEVKITQAFYNLLINAINFTGGDKTVKIRQSVRDGFIKIEVMDSGKGISPADLPYIWDRYYKADKDRMRAMKGTGLGLSIVKKIIELHGGGYGVQTSQGKGSVFWFTLAMD